MISTIECLYKIDQKLNKLSTFSNQEIPVEDKLLALNEAQIESTLSKIDINNVYHLGMDGFRKRYEDLEELIVPHETIPLVIYPSPIGVYRADLSILKNSYLLYSDIFILADKDSCTDRILSVNIIKHSDLNTYLTNTNYNPSFEYQETIGTIASHHLMIYTDGSFTPTESHISYLTYPTSFDLEGYIKLDGTDSVTADSNLPSYMTDEIVAIAVRKLAGSTANIEALQNSQLDLQKAD